MGGLEDSLWNNPQEDQVGQTVVADIRKAGEQLIEP
jgi:hypothetical protein